MVDEEMGMPAKRELSMRQLRRLLRLHHGGVSAREIGRRLGVARSTVQDNLKRAAAAGLPWPLADDVTDDALERRVAMQLGRALLKAGGADAEALALFRKAADAGDVRGMNNLGYMYKNGLGVPKDGGSCAMASESRRFRLLTPQK